MLFCIFFYKYGLYASRKYNTNYLYVVHEGTFSITFNNLLKSFLLHSYIIINITNNLLWHCLRLLKCTNG